MLEIIKSKIGQSVICMTLCELQEYFKPTSILVVDIETSGHNKLPGDTPSYPNHGISGVALCNMFGDSVYAVINDKREYNGILVADFIGFLNVALVKAQVVITHHGVFDLAFLLSRGLDRKEFEKKRWIDTWIDSTIRLNGVFKSNKLKEHIKEKFGIEPASEKAKDDFFEQNNTKDYGDLPIELIAPYAQDDVRYTLILATCQEPMSAGARKNHDMYARNCLHLIDASARGCAVSLPLMKLAINEAKETMVNARAEVQALLGATAVNLDDEQETLHYLHSINLHSGPREMFGEVGYIWDRDFVSQYIERSPLLMAYFKFHESRLTVQCLGAQNGDMATKVFREESGTGPGAAQNVGLHVSMHPSIFSRGGLIELKAPDVANKLLLTEAVRRLFVAREFKMFVVCTAPDVKRSILLHRLGGPSMGTDPVAFMAQRTGMEYNACRVLFDKMCDGFGNSVLAQRFILAGVKFSQANRSHLQMGDKFESNLPNFNILTSWLESERTRCGGVADEYERYIQIPDDKRWRTLAIWLTSVSGGFLSHCLDLFCRTANALDAGLVLAHRNEFVFEVEPDQADTLVAALTEISKQHPKFPDCWVVKKQMSWAG